MRSRCLERARARVAAVAFARVRPAARVARESVGLAPVKNGFPRFPEERKVSREELSRERRAWVGLKHAQFRGRIHISIETQSMC